MKPEHFYFNDFLKCFFAVVLLFICMFVCFVSFFLLQLHTVVEFECYLINDEF